MLGHTDTVVALTAGTAPGGLDVVVLGRAMPGEHHRMQGRWSPATLRALRRAMFEHDITVAHGSSTLLACAIAGGGRRRPFVYRQVSDPTVWAASLPGGCGWRRRCGAPGWSWPSPTPPPPR
ncbi:MAG: hypothetical protein R2690_18185 [Acidimicrobiales bacterium]